MTGAAPAYRVKFIMELNYGSKAQKDRLGPVYGDRFVSLLKEAKGKRYAAIDYAALPGLRDLVREFPTLDLLLPHLQGKVPQDKIVGLLEVAPLFNMAPPDLKAYVLMGAGSRATLERKRATA